MKKKKKVKKTIKKKPAKIATKKKSKTGTSKKPAKKTKKKSQKPDVDGQLIGRATHYFPHVNAAVVVIDKGNLKVGDHILIKGHTTRFEEVIQSMQIDHQPIQAAKKGDEVGLFVKERVREHDLVYKLK